jgi:predicted ATPase/class 3 adenylate cyclase
VKTRTDPPAQLPTGTVTFVFSDIEGSTRLLQRLGEAYPAVLETHHRLLREAFAAHGGVEVSTEGDSFFVVFPSAPSAVAAAVKAQRVLAARAWPEGVEVRVRIGVHTGEGTLGADNYVGVDLHRAARIAGSAHGGQVLLSEATRGLVEDAIPEGVSLRDLGEHRLKDLDRPERLFQVTVPGLPTDFPPPRSLTARAANLPPQLTSFVGRRRESQELGALLSEARLVTLTGPGGTGKTRLAVHVARDQAGEFEDGAWFVALAPIADPSLVVSTALQALGVSEDPTRPPVETLVVHLRGKRLLLVLDNFEQVLDAAPHVGQIVAATQGVKVIVTSREPLGLHGEREFPVPPMALPDVADLPPLESISRYEAVALFIDRARAVQPTFAVTTGNAPAVAEIVARLDGLPLAIELAAARVKILTPEAILRRLGHSLSLLSGGARDLPARQQTLLDAIAWSYDLLDEAERRLFARLSVFVGGFTLEAAEAVCNVEGELGLDTFQGVASLVNKSLLRHMEMDTGEPWFFMLQTIREFALERLAEAADATVHRRHARYFMDLAERGAPELTGDRQVSWLDLLHREHDNLRAAMEWAAENGYPEAALRTAGALWRFWQMRGHLREASDRLSRVLELPETGVDPEARARALEAAGSVAYWMGAFRNARSFYEQALDTHRLLGNDHGIAEQLYNLSFVFMIPAPPEQDLPRARRLLEEGLGVFRRIGDDRGAAKALWGLGNMLFQSGEFEVALATGEEALEANRRVGDRFSEAWALWLVGATALGAGDHVAAAERLRAALRMFSQVGDTSAVPVILIELAGAALAAGEQHRAVVLHSAALALEESIGTGLGEATAERRALGETLRREVPEEDAANARAEGARMSLKEAVAYALGDTAEPVHRSPTP